MTVQEPLTLSFMAVALIVAVPTAMPVNFRLCGSNSMTPAGLASQDRFVLEAPDGEMFTLTYDSSPISTEDLAAVTLTPVTATYSTVMLQVRVTPLPSPVSVVVPFLSPVT